MNRLATYVGTNHFSTRPRGKARNAATPAHHEVESEFRKEGLTYRTLAPLGYEKNYAYPLVIWLHGPGDDERQLLTIMQHVSLQNYVAIAPRGPVSEPNGSSYTWSQDDLSVSDARRFVHECLTIAHDVFHVHRDRIFIAGYQSGGTMALRLALSEPERFAGAISIGGKFPLGCNALLRYQTAQDLPLLLMRGTESATYPQTEYNDELRVIHAARLAAHYRHYLCGDELFTDMLRDMNSWLMEQVTGTSILDTESTFSSGS